MKSSSWHASHSSWQRNERANHRQQPPKENGQITPAQKKAVSPIKLAPPHQDPTSIPLHQWTTAIAPNFISHQRTQITSNRTRRCHPQQLECPREYQISSKRHDQFRWQRNARRFNRHQQRHTSIARRADNGINKHKDDSKKFFSHESYDEEWGLD